MVGTYIAHTCPLEAPNTLDGAIHSIHSLGVEGREERVLEGVVRHRLAQVRVHLARGGEDALPTPADETGTANCWAIMWGW